MEAINEVLVVEHLGNIMGSSLAWMPIYCTASNVKEPKTFSKKDGGKGENQFFSASFNLNILHLSFVKWY